MSSEVGFPRNSLCNCTKLFNTYDDGTVTSLFLEGGSSSRDFVIVFGITQNSVDILLDSSTILNRL